MTITDEQIQALKQEAQDHGDYRMAAICRLALLADDALPENLTINQARRECERVIEDALAQEEE